jgi:hypothetical protein
MSGAVLGAVSASDHEQHGIFSFVFLCVKKSLVDASLFDENSSTETTSSGHEYFAKMA